MKFSLGGKYININLNLPVGGMVLLTIVFVILRALGYITWSWFWVFSPLWIIASLTLLIVLIVVIVVYISTKDF